MSRSAKKHFLETSFDINPRSSIILVSGFSLILKSMRSVPVPGFRSGRILVRPIPPEAVGSGWWTQVKFFRKFFDFFNTNVWKLPKQKFQNFILPLKTTNNNKNVLSLDSCGRNESVIWKVSTRLREPIYLYISISGKLISLWIIRANISIRILVHLKKSTAGENNLTHCDCLQRLLAAKPHIRLFAPRLADLARQTCRS